MSSTYRKVLLSIAVAELAKMGVPAVESTHVLRPSTTEPLPVGYADARKGEDQHAKRQRKRQQKFNAVSMKGRKL